MKTLGKIKQAPVVNEILTVFQLIGKGKVAANAAGLSFYLFLSMIPLFILLCSLLPYTGIGAEELTEVITRLTPEAINGLLASVIEEAYASRVALFSLSCVFLLWSAAKLMTALLRALDAIYGQEESRGYFPLLARALLFTAALVLLAGVLLLVSVKGRTAEELMAAMFDAPRLTGVWAAFGKKLLTGCVCTAAFAVVYRFAPAGKRGLLRQLPGAVFAAAGVMLFSLIFSIYSAGGNIYNSFYGSLAGVALLLFYVYICFQIFLIGGILNRRLCEGKCGGVERELP